MTTVVKARVALAVADLNRDVEHHAGRLGVRDLSPAFVGSYVAEVTRLAGSGRYYVRLLVRRPKENVSEVGVWNNAAEFLRCVSMMRTAVCWFGDVIERDRAGVRL